jgi:pimeloyl-ACP methyl ester carboxylesterase
MHEANFFFPETYDRIPDFESATVSLKNVNILPDKGTSLAGIILSYKNSGDYLLYFYGNGSSVVESYPRLKYLCETYKLNVICFDYRSYGFSTGKPSFEAIMSDGLFIYDHVRETFEKKIKHILIYTQSIGTPVGLQVATQRKVDGMIMEAGFTRGRDAVEHMTDAQPGISRFLVHLKADNYLANYPDPPVEKIKRVKVPLIYFHGTLDDVFPFAMGKELFEAAGSIDKTFCAMEGFKHANMDISTGKYRKETEKFLKKFK